MKSFVFGLLAVTGFAISAGSASAQYVIVPHRSHTHVVPVYSAPAVQYYQPPVVTNFGSSYFTPSYGYQSTYSQPRVSFGVNFGSPSFGGGFGSPSFGGFGSGYQNYGHHHHHHGHR
jgi:hypothetical protein